MQYAILRHGKIKASGFGAVIAHNYRTSLVDKCNIDKALTPLNWIQERDGTPMERLKSKLNSLPKKPRKDAVVAVELVLSLTPEWFEQATKDRQVLRSHPKLTEWVQVTRTWLKSEFGDDLIDLALHLDETSPHMHALIVPMTPDGRLCAKEVLARMELQRRQTSYADAMKHLGLVRGTPASVTKRRHIGLSEKPDDDGSVVRTLKEQLEAAVLRTTQLERQNEELSDQLKEANELKNMQALIFRPLEAEKNTLAKQVQALQAQIQALQAPLAPVSVPEPQPVTVQAPKAPMELPKELEDALLTAISQYCFYKYLDRGETREKWLEWRQRDHDAAIAWVTGWAIEGDGGEMPAWPEAKQPAPERSAAQRRENDDPGYSR